MADETVGEATPSTAQTSDTVNKVNLKTLGEATSFWTSALMAEHSANVIMTNTIRAQLLKNVVEVDPAESVAVQKLLTGNDLGQQLAQLGVIIAQLQQATQVTRGTSTTPPVTP